MDPVVSFEMTTRPQASAADAPLDGAGVERLRSDFGSRAFGRLVEMFADKTPERLTEIRMAIEAGNVPAVGESAHKLKGGCLTLAATHMAELCEALETLAGDGSLDGAATLVDQIESAFDEAHAALLAEMS